LFRGTSENAAFRIIKNGFGTVASLDDGFYGRGMYFTSSFKYASSYAQITPHGKVFLIALTVPGNPYPATEPPFVADEKAPEGKSLNTFGLLGQACKAGYQSHYLEATQSGQPAMDVVEGFGDELVVFEGSQTLPLFLVYTTEFGGGQGKKPSEETGPKGWSFLSQVESGSGEPNATIGEKIIPPNNAKWMRDFMGQ